MLEMKKKIAFIGSECYPFVKTGGLGDVMYALPKALMKQDCDVKVFVPCYSCIPAKYRDEMKDIGSFDMDLSQDGKRFYVGIKEYTLEGVTYIFIDNEDFYSWGKPYTDLYVDIPKYCFFAKAALAIMNYLEWIPEVIHCHDWQAGLTPAYVRTLFANTPVGSAKTMFTIHNLRFQGICSSEHMMFWTGLPAEAIYDQGAAGDGFGTSNMLKAGLSYTDMITTVSNTYAEEIQTDFYGEHLDGHLRYLSDKLCGIVNGIDYDIWNADTDARLAVNYNVENVIEKKAEAKLELQKELELEQDSDKFVIGLISRLTDQKGLDLVNTIIPQIMDEKTQIVVLGTGDPVYEESFRYYEKEYKGNVSSSITYDESLAHRIYAAADAFLVPSLFEPCGLTQLIAMHYGTVPIVRETGGLKDTVDPYNKYENSGNGFTFDRYEADLLLDAVNRAKDLYFEEHSKWNEMIVRDMEKDFSWENSAAQYLKLYESL